jgi:hypothetical protein
MAKLTQRSSGMWETPQITSEQSATEFYGGMAPSKEDVIKSANARGQKRHEMKRQGLADLEVLPDSAELAGNELVGIRGSGYLTKKNLEFGVNAMYNTLPPGMDIEDQENCDIREEQLVIYDRGLGYPGDGWARRPRGEQMLRKMDVGRPEKTNYLGTKALNPKNPTGQ